jgi:hypothetical protein
LHLHIVVTFVISTFPTSVLLLPTAELIINTAPARLVQMFQQRYKNSHRILCKLSGTGEKSNLKTVSNLEILQEVVKKPQHPDTGLNNTGESIEKPEVFHPRPDGKGKPVKIDNPTSPEPMSAFDDPSQYAVMLPVTDMVGGGPFHLKPGQWTDDTSMALCLATSLLESQGFDADDQMQRYCRWQEEGYLSSSGRCFDIGNTVSSALRSYKTHGNSYAGSTEAWSAGNGSLMRLAPIPLFYYPDIEQAVAFAAESSRTTHGADEYIDARRLYSRQLLAALAGKDKENLLFANSLSFSGAAKIASIANGNYRFKSEHDIRGTGYVVDCLEAALWCF